MGNESVSDPDSNVSLLKIGNEQIMFRFWFYFIARLGNSCFFYWNGNGFPFFHFLSTRLDANELESVYYSFDLY